MKWLLPLLLLVGCIDPPKNLVKDAAEANKSFQQKVNESVSDALFAVSLMSERGRKSIRFGCSEDQVFANAVSEVLREKGFTTQVEQGWIGIRVRQKYFYINISW